MKKLLNITGIIFLFTNLSYGQLDDTVKANTYVETAKKLLDSQEYDSAASFYLLASKIFEQKRIWLSCTKNYRFTSYSYIRAFEIDTSLYYIKIAHKIAELNFTKSTKEEAFESAEIDLQTGYIYFLKNDYKKSLEYYQKSYQTVFQTDSLEKIKLSRILSLIAGIYRHLGNYDKAIDYCKSSLLARQQKLGNNHVLVATNLDDLGIFYSFKGNFDTSLYYCQKALEIWKLNYSGYNDKIANCYNTIGSNYESKHMYSKALEAYSKALEHRINSLKENHPDIGIIYNNLGGTNKKIGNIQKALDFYNKAIQLYTNAYGSIHPNIALTNQNIGWLYLKIGNFTEAIKYSKKALQTRLQIYGDEHDITANTYYTIGDIYLKKDHYVRALEYYNKALLIKIQVLGENSADVANIYHGIGGVYQSIGDYKKAIDIYKKALNIRTSIFGEEHPVTAQTYINIGQVHDKLGDSEQAINDFFKALELLLKAYGEDHYIIAHCYNNIGGIYEDKSDYNKAIEYQHKALKVYINAFGDKHPDVANTYYYIGNLYKYKHDYENTIKNYQKAIIANILDFNDSNIYSNPNSLTALSDKYLLKTLADKGHIFHLIYKNVEDSQKIIEMSISTDDLFYKLINKMRTDYNDEETKLFLDSYSRNYFEKAIDLAIDYNNITGRNEKVLEYIEKSKSTILSSYLSDLKMGSYNKINDSLTKKELEIVSNRRLFETNLQEEKAKYDKSDSALVQYLQDKLFHCSRQYDNLMTTLKNDYPDYYQLKYQQNVATINELQQQMDNKTALLNYFVADTSLFIAAVTKDSVVYKVIKTDSLFNDQLIDYHIDIEYNFTKDELQASANLYNYLIAPVEDLIAGKNKLVIIPDEKLYYVPFETLCKKGDDINHPDYLIKNYAINYHHSATLWLNSKEKEHKNVAQNSFIGFAPVFDPTVSNGYIVSNEWIADTTDVDMATRSISNDFTSFNALPNTEDEIKSILKLFNKKSNKADGYLHKEASEENFKQEVNKYKYVHIASHSFTNDKYPALSGIAFSQPDTTNRKENDEDGILYAGESYNLNLSNADLVVLSSCKSGLGKLIKGEGFLSLSRGFIYSGAPNIVYSLWSVNDEPTKNLMVYFYKQILNGKGYAEALRAAKLKIMSNPKTSQPKYWAAWVLLGK